jgi:NAD-dependent dihydropyrimidine dehydrogenase PreA subunit
MGIDFSPIYVTILPSIKPDRVNMEGTYMAYVISDECISCGSCAEQCPVSAISEGDEHFVIDPETCISCGSCAGECPVSAISEE